MKDIYEELYYNDGCTGLESECGSQKYHQGIKDALEIVIENLQEQLNKLE